MNLYVYLYLIMWRLYVYETHRTHVSGKKTPHFSVRSPLLNPPLTVGEDFANSEKVVNICKTNICSGDNSSNSR